LRELAHSLRGEVLRDRTERQRGGTRIAEAGRGVGAK
jgi:hypothetical protein